MLYNVTNLNNINFHIFLILKLFFVFFINQFSFFYLSKTKKDFYIKSWVIKTSFFFFCIPIPYLFPFVLLFLNVCLTINFALPLFSTFCLLLLYFYLVIKMQINTVVEKKINLKIVCQKGRRFNMKIHQMISKY